MQWFALYFNQIKPVYNSHLSMQSIYITVYVIQVINQSIHVDKLLLIKKPGIWGNFKRGYTVSNACRNLSK